MSKLDTIEYEDKVYQVGAVYEFSDDNWDTYDVDVLVGLHGKIAVESIRSCYASIRLCKSTIGVITDVPLKLEDGEWYMCKVNLDNVEHVDFPLIFNTGNWFADKLMIRRCDDEYGIKPLYKMVKA